MKKLVYYLDKEDEYVPLYEYSLDHIGVDECYARQLCTYFIMQGRQYELVSNEMSGDEEQLVIMDRGKNRQGTDERTYNGQGLHIEIRRFKESENYRLLTTIPCATHYDVIRYLVKNVIDLRGHGQMLVTSTEIDEDRGVYVLYVAEIGEVEL